MPRGLIKVGRDEISRYVLSPFPSPLSLPARGAISQKQKESFGNSQCTQQQRAACDLSFSSTRDAMSRAPLLARSRPVVSVVNDHSMTASCDLLQRRVIYCGAVSRRRCERCPHIVESRAVDARFTAAASNSRLPAPFGAGRRLAVP